MNPSPKLLAFVDATATSAGVSPELVKGVIQTESAWDPAAVSPVGAVGLMQLMPATAQGLGWDGASDLRDPAVNVALGVRYLRQLLDMFGGDWAKAAAAYNHGPGIPGPGPKKNWPGVRGKLARAGGDWEKAQPFLPTETRLYWRKVLNWAGVWAGKISRAEAQLMNAAGEVSATVGTWAQTALGRSTALLLLCVALAGALVIGGRR